MVSNSAQLDRRTKQHTQFGVSASNGTRDIYGPDKIVAGKKKKKEKKEHRQSHKASPTGIANKEVNISNNKICRNLFCSYLML